MRLNAASALAALVLALILAAPAGAAGEAGSNIRRTPGDSAAFTLTGSNGYRLYFKSEKGMLTITVTRTRPLVASIAPTGKLIPPQRGATTESVYTTRGVSRDPTKIEADLGDAGEVSLVFHPSGEERVTPVDLDSKSERCVGATKITRRLGTFFGSVSFQGEHGYTAAVAISVPGTVGTSPFRNCTTKRRRPAPGRAADSGGANQVSPLEAAFTVNGPAATLIAFRNSERSNYFVFNSEELSDGFFVFRTAQATGGPDLFSFRGDGKRAHLKPPAPFSGAATFADPPAGPRSWSGSLAVSFPGGEQALTGKGIFRPTLRLSAPD
jgi:hypothetical protein